MINSTFQSTVQHIGRSTVQLSPIPQTAKEIREHVRDLMAASRIESIGESLRATNDQLRDPGLTKPRDRCASATTGSSS